MERTRAFTLVELLTVMAIIAILSGILMPAAMSARAMAFQYTTSQALGQLGTASSMYASDFDETFMPAFYPVSNGMQFWFGTRDSSFAIHPEFGLLRQYTGRKRLADSTFHAKDYLGDKSGFGYNWAFLGSDFGVTGDYSSFPYCQNPAHASELSNPSKTIVLATSSYYYAAWLPKGDSQTYDFGFIDAPGFWYGNPNVDFRHMGFRSPDTLLKIVTSTGNAPVVYADSHTAARKQTQVLNENFSR
jgi:prepilin-type N-terminal cleavage/methylation domain-containing protein